MIYNATYGNNSVQTGITNVGTNVANVGTKAANAITSTKMSSTRMISVVLSVIFVIVVYNMLSPTSTTLSSSIKPAVESRLIEAKDLDSSGAGSSSTNFSYSIWIYVDEWNYRLADRKIIFGRKKSPEANPCPMVSLTPVDNNLEVKLNVFSDETGNDNNYVIYTNELNNIPIQRWTNILVSVYGRTMDIYVDGKLTKTSVMPGTANISPNAPVYLTPDGGFSGWTSKFAYYASPTNPRQAWDIYQSGFGSYYSLSNIFGNYSMKMSVMDGEKESGSITI